LYTCIEWFVEESFSQWQVEQLPPEQELQLEPEPMGDVLEPLDRTAKALNSFVTLPLLQDGHATASSFDRSKTSKTERHSLQVYSYTGIGFLFEYRGGLEAVHLQI
jgi:hypothetical protein